MSGQEQSNGSLRMRRRTAAWFTENNPILFMGQFGYETDTRKMKLGDGETAWADLPYMDTDETDDNAGGGSILGLRYAYSSTTSASGIAAGTFRLNETDFSSATKLYIHNTDGLNYAQAAYWDLFTSGTITLHRSSPEGYVTFKVTRMVAQTGYHEFDVVFVGGATGFLNTDEIRMAVTMDMPGVRRLVFNGLVSGGAGFTIDINSLVIPSDDIEFSTSGTGNFIVSTISGNDLFDGDLSDVHIAITNDQGTAIIARTDISTTLVQFNLYDALNSMAAVNPDSIRVEIKHLG